MLTSFSFEIVFILVLILANGFLAMAEIAIITARKARLQRRADEGDEKARQALLLAKDPADLLSTVQIGITLVGVLAGAFAGATFAAKLAEWLGKIPALAPFSEAIAITVVVVIITYLTLVLGELVPKRLALNKPEDVASRVAGPMRRLSLVSTPLVRFLSGSTNLVLQILGVKPTTEVPITEEEIKILLEQGTQAGVFAEVEQDMVEAIFRLDDRNVGALMIPRTEIIWLDLEDAIEENRKKIISSVHSRFPVAQGDLDHVVGIIQAKDMLACYLAGKSFDLVSVMVQPLIIPESTPALRVLDMFKESGIHMAMIIGEFGGLEGMVTLYDILEAIVGEISLPGEPLEPEVVQREDGSWLIDGLLPVDEFKEMFDIVNLPQESRRVYQTVGGFVMAYLGRIPTAGDYFDWGGLRYEVADMDGFRVDKLIVEALDENVSDHLNTD